MNDKKIVLVVGMGTSPAVMTETVWALAHQSDPVVPDEVVVITTKSGKDALRTAIMSGAPSVWNRLKTALAKEKIAIDGKLVFGDTSLRVIPDADGNEASDLRTGADNLRAADFMLTLIQEKHSHKAIVSGSMRHAFLFADDSENGCSQSLFYVLRTSQNGWSYGVLRRRRSTIRRGNVQDGERQGGKMTDYILILRYDSTGYVLAKITHHLVSPSSPDYPLHIEASRTTHGGLLNNKMQTKLKE